MTIDEIKKFLSDTPGYQKEGKRRLKRILQKKGHKPSLSDCAIALREMREEKEKSQEFKRLFFDIETSPNIGLFWRPGYKVRLTPDNIIDERAIICVSYKWEGEDKVHTITWDNGNDYNLVKEFAEVLKYADEIVAHNGDFFDVKWLRTRALYHGIPFNTYIKTLDTYKKARAQFEFNSFKLDYIAKFLKVGGKIETGGFDLWKKITLNHDKEALATMVKYCENDVIILEDVYHKIESYIKPNSHVGVHEGGHKGSCPCCGSENVKHIGNLTTTAGTVQRHMECRDCGTDFKLSNTAFLKMNK